MPDHPSQVGTVFRFIKVGEEIQSTDWVVRGDSFVRVAVYCPSWAGELYGHMLDRHMRSLFKGDLAEIVRVVI